MGFFLSNDEFLEIPQYSISTFYSRLNDWSEPVGRCPLLTSSTSWTRSSNLLLFRPALHPLPLCLSLSSYYYRFHWFPSSSYPRVNIFSFETKCKIHQLCWRFYQNIFKYLSNQIFNLSATKKSKWIAIKNIIPTLEWYIDLIIRSNS